MTTFAIVGHDEAQTLPAAAAQVLEAAGPGDATVFVDSASTDGSAEVAAREGLTVWPASLGKGAAMREALRRNEHPWVVFLDADIVGSERNLAAVLGRAAAAAPPSVGMVLGDFEDRPAGSVLSNTWAIYEPLVAGLFPELADGWGEHPLTGFRAVRAEAVADLLAEVPGDFGVEAWLNVRTAVGGWAHEVVHLGWYRGRFRYKPAMGHEIATPLLDVAQAVGRLDAGQRAAWEAWVGDVVAVIGGYRGADEGRAEYLADLAAVRSRPLPSARQDGAS